MMHDGMGWDGMGWDGMGWDGMEWDGMGWDGMGWNAVGCGGMGLAGIRYKMRCNIMIRYDKIYHDTTRHDTIRTLKSRRAVVSAPKLPAHGASARNRVRNWTKSILYNS